MTWTSVADLPPNFRSEVISSGWNQAVGVTFSANGRMFVWEKAGRVYFEESGQRALLLDISEEVGDWRDFGLLGFALDPDFYATGYIYLLYVVDYHHLRFAGTPQYDPLANEYFHDTIGRITRYTCNAADGRRSVDPASRLVLLGNSMSSGFPICHQSHGVGTLYFGTDGTLLAGCGDGASYLTADLGGAQFGSSNTALPDGIIRDAEDVGAFRAQLVNSLSGKIVRIDPATGDGLPSNPFYDPVQPSAARSRVWALGLRNPYRFSIRPQSGSADPSDGRPGAIYIGDVGWYQWEELNVCTAPGQNFGWPAFEGFSNSPYPVGIVNNLDAPNPLAGGACDDYFTFNDLLIQDSLSPAWPNPCDAAQQISAAQPHFMHRRPSVAWFHDPIGPARVGIFNAGIADAIDLDSPQSPAPGPRFGGNCSIAGAWYTGAAFPAQFRNTYFHADFVHGWIHSFRFDANDQLLSVQRFGDHLGLYITDLKANPVDDALYVVAFDAKGDSAVHRIAWVENLPPIAVALPALSYGPAPLSVQFNSSGTLDPEGGPITYTWDFGDGSPPSYSQSPSHTFDRFPLEDVTLVGDIIARVFELTPPHPTGAGNQDPETLRDGDMPAVGTLDPQRQFDTFHDADQFDFDFVGYSFATTQQFEHILFQEGIHFSDGGWFDDLHVQVFSAGQWNDVADVTVAPPYPANDGVPFQRFSLSFPTTSGTAIRLAGTPGGTAHFISVGELRIFARSQTPLTEPRAYVVSLTVEDSLRATTTALAAVTVNNTPPRVQIESPMHLSTYSLAAPTDTALLATIADDEQGPAELTCAWETILHHEQHQHFEPADPNCTSMARLDPIGCGLETYFYSVRLTVTDAAGLSASAEAIIYPACCALDGCQGVDIAQPLNCEVDVGDLTTLLSAYGSVGVNLPGDTQAPFGEVDIADLSYLLSKFGTICN